MADKKLPEISADIPADKYFADYLDEYIGDVGIQKAEHMVLLRLAQHRNISGEKAEMPRRWLITSVDDLYQHNTAAYDSKEAAEQGVLSRLETDLCWTESQCDSYQRELNIAESWSDYEPWKGVYQDTLQYGDGDEYKLIIVEITA